MKRLILNGLLVLLPLGFAATAVAAETPQQVRPATPQVFPPPTPLPSTSPQYPVTPTPVTPTPTQITPTPTPPVAGLPPMISTYRTTCGPMSCSVGCSSLYGCGTTVYNAAIRLEAGRLQADLLILANTAGMLQGRGGDEIECLAESAATAAWNFKQIAGASNVRYYILDRLEELRPSVEMLRLSFNRLALSGERTSFEAFNGVISSWTNLENLVQAMP